MLKTLLAKVGDDLIHMVGQVPDEEWTESGIVDSLLEVLTGYGYPVYKQGSMSADEEYPETFLTFWNDESLDRTFYDNVEHGIVMSFNLFCYSSDVEKTYSVLERVRKDLKKEGWITSRSYDAASDQETHTGRGMAATFLGN